MCQIPKCLLQVCSSPQIWMLRMLRLWMHALRLWMHALALSQLQLPFQPIHALLQHEQLVTFKFGARAVRLGYCPRALVCPSLACRRQRCNCRRQCDWHRRCHGGLGRSPGQPTTPKTHCFSIELCCIFWVPNRVFFLGTFFFFFFQTTQKKHNAGRTG